MFELFLPLVYLLRCKEMFGLFCTYEKKCKEEHRNVNKRK